MTKVQFLSKEELVFKTKPTNPNFTDKTDCRFGRLMVIGFAGSNKTKTGAVATWYCECDCGNIAIISTGTLNGGHTKSCGCLRVETTRRRATTHGHNRPKNTTKTYKSWAHMFTRCYSKNDKAYHNYGGRGITVCERWRKFENFLEDMGKKPVGNFFMDRIDVNGNYEPGNLRWATSDEHHNNKRRSVYIELGGNKLSVSQWSRELSVNPSTLFSRIGKLQWSKEDVVRKPIIFQNKQQ